MPHIFGVRHHGPGSARQLLIALEALQPEAVLIEGPSDASDLLTMIDHVDMVPPVALLTYPKDEPNQARFWPFAEYSPEYQAALWAVRNGKQVRFIDLPATWEPITETEEDELSGNTDEGDDTEKTVGERPTDPIGALAHLAGYEDGESWWRNVIEENPDPGPVFAAISDAMSVLREDETFLPEREKAREAHMRLEIAKARRELEGEVAVVCGAWHVPALKEKQALKDDRAIIRSKKKRALVATWAPWTAERLAFSSGYGAGVDAPNWCHHLWMSEPQSAGVSWLVKIAAILREEGHIVSTASVIEAERLACVLSAMRGRALPGFEEYREAAIACLCAGEELLWKSIAPRILIGSDVGSVPSDVPLAPLLADLKQQQKKAKLKPEALDREVSVDLRSESGLFRSTLLHRLSLLGVHWGKLADSGRSRGTFREKWVLRWEPEFAIQLIENLIYGATLEQAATGKLDVLFREQNSLKALSELVLSALTAQLPEAANAGLRVLQQSAALSTDCLDLLSSLPSIGVSIRYGAARKTDLSGLSALFEQIVVQGSFALPYAARNLDRDAASALREAIMASDAAIELLETDKGSELVRHWSDGLKALKSDPAVSPLVAGLALRLLYQAELVTADETSALLQRAISPGTKTSDAADFFEGFFDKAASSLIYDDALRSAVDDWLLNLTEEDFIQNLPLFRRVLSALDQSERSRLLDRLFGRQTSALPGLRLAENADEIWARQFVRVAGIMTVGQSDD